MRERVLEAMHLCLCGQDGACIGWHIWGVSLFYAGLLRLFMQELLREIILQPNYTVIMEMRSSCFQTQTQNDDETMKCVTVGYADSVRWLCIFGM